jgi:DNA invertase Pin-like site-specific DNA recombinase
VIRAALYHRVSTLDQDPTLARNELRAAAIARGMTIVDEIEETGSGARNDRPKLVKLLQDAQRGRIDAVICWKLDRFGRSAFDVLANLRALEDAGVRFIAVTQGIDIKPAGDAMSRLMLTMLAAVAEFERELIIERTRLGLARARRNGTRLGRPSSGRAPEAEVVLDLRGAGWSWPEIARRLGCSVMAARRASGWAPREAVEKGVENPPSISVEDKVGK